MWVRDPEKVSGKLLGSHISCSVRTECSSGCTLAAGAVVPAAVGPSSGAAAGSAAAEAGGSSSPSKQAALQQGGGEGVAVFEVRRRFDDFEVLSRLLKSHFRGYFIPRLPPRCGCLGDD